MEQPLGKTMLILQYWDFMAMDCTCIVLISRGLASPPPPIMRGHTFLQTEWFPQGYRNIPFLLCPVVLTLLSIQGQDIVKHCFMVSCMKKHGKDVLKSRD